MQDRIDDEYDFPLACADLAYPEARMDIEYDGDVHFNRRNGASDRQRDVILAGYGWLTVHFLRDDLDAAQTPHRITHLLRTRGHTGVLSDLPPDPVLHAELYRTGLPNLIKSR